MILCLHICSKSGEDINGPISCRSMILHSKIIVSIILAFFTQLHSIQFQLKLGKCVKWVTTIEFRLSFFFNSCSNPTSFFFLYRFRVRLQNSILFAAGLKKSVEAQYIVHSCEMSIGVECVVFFFCC